MNITIAEADKFLNKIPNCLRNLQKDKDSLISLFPKDILELVIRYSIPKIGEIKYGGGYGRRGIITVDSDMWCMICCKWNCRGLYADSSNGEYASVDICQDCINNLFKYC